MSSCVRDLVVAAAERRLLGEERDQVLLGLAPDGLVGGRPHRAAAHVAQVEELAPGIARRVLAVARDRAAAAEARAPAGVGDDRRVAAVRQELRVRKERVRRAEAAHGLGRRRPATRVSSTGRGCVIGRVARHALLQQQLRGLHARVGVEALHHEVAEQRVGERDERHALVVGHVGAHHRPPDGPAAASVSPSAGSSAPRVRVVDGLVEAVRALEPSSARRRRLRGARRGLEHRGERRGVRRHHQSSPRPRFRPRPGTPKALYW